MDETLDWLRGRQALVWKRRNDVIPFQLQADYLWVYSFSGTVVTVLEYNKVWGYD